MTMIVERVNLTINESFIKKVELMSNNEGDKSKSASPQFDWAIIDFD
jgi:hypothetical protein